MDIYHILRAFQLLRDAHFPLHSIQCYVLIGFHDTPDDALYRLQLVQSLGLLPNPMRYNPLDTLTRDSYVPPNWTATELQRYVRYFSNLRFFRHIPFNEWNPSRTRNYIPLPPNPATPRLF